MHVRVEHACEHQTEYFMTGRAHECALHFRRKKARSAAWCNNPAAAADVVVRQAVKLMRFFNGFSFAHEARRFFGGGFSGRSTLACARVRTRVSGVHETVNLITL